MSANHSLTVDQSLKLLKSYSCLEPKLVHSETEKTELQQAIQQIISLSEYENLGICADSSETARQVLNQYLKALGYEAQLDQSTLLPQETPIYLKFNTKKMSHYLDDYDGQYRGVLISCQSEDDNIAGTYGYFPLDLFA